MNQNYFISKDVSVEGKPLVGLNAKEYENPADSITLSALKLNKAFDTVFKKMIEYSFEKVQLIRHKSSCFLATKENMPYLIDCVEKACNILGIEKIPEVYIQQGELINAFTAGVQNPILIFNSGLLHNLNHEELMYFIGHELGHIKSEHVQYTTLAAFYFEIIKRIADANIISLIATTGLDIAIHKWWRCSELTADRAGLLVCQHLPSAITAIAKLCGCPIDIYDKLDANMFLKQVAAFDIVENNSYNKFIEFVSTLGDSHPLGVLRAKELMLWVQSGEYAKIMLRNSTWAEKEVERLSQATQTALEKKDNLVSKSYDIATKSVAADEDLEAAKQFESTQTGFKRVAAWGKKVAKDTKAKNSKAQATRVDKQLTKADLSYEKALASETALKAVFKTATPEEIEKLTSDALGNLTYIQKTEQ